MGKLKRLEVKCSICGKSRYLSIDELGEDGWRMDLQRGLVCFQCIPKYGIPTTQFSRKVDEEIELNRLKRDHYMSHLMILD